MLTKTNQNNLNEGQINIYIYYIPYDIPYTLKTNAALNTTQCLVKYGQTQRCWPNSCVKSLTLPLGKNYRVAGLVHISPSFYFFD